MSAFQDRAYQTEAVNSVWNYFRTKQGNPLIGMPTGTGKSVVIARLLQSVFAVYPQQRIMILTHVKELIRQNYEKLIMLWPFAPAGIYSAGLKKKQSNAAITFAGIASVANKWALFGHIDLVFIDEAHLLSPNDETQYRKFLTGLKSINPNVKVVGFTATPWRLGHGHLTNPYVDKKGNTHPPLFTDMCFDITSIEPFNRLIAEGYISPLIPKRTKLELDVDKLHKRGGEFIESEMQELFDKDEITLEAIKEAMELGSDRKSWLVFASGVDHCENVADMLNSMGIPAEAVHSKRSDRDENIAKFQQGLLRAIVNNNVLTTGFDHPNIDLIIVLRATASSGLWVQMLGRGTRPLYADGFDLNTIDGRLAAIAASEKQDCLVLDYARNTAKLGPVNDPVIPKSKGDGGGEAPIKVCDVCDTYNHISARNCIVCGTEFSFEVKFKATAASEELIKAELPVVRTFAIDHICYDIHSKMDKPEMLKVSYYCGLKVFSEYVCVAHGGWAQRKAARWWKERSDEPMPESAQEALEVVTTLMTPTNMRVWTNKKYPEIMSFCYDGSDFGVEEPCPIQPSVEKRVPHKYKAPEKIDGDTVQGGWADDLDDDIPF